MEILIFVLGLALGLILAFIFVRYRRRKEQPVGVLRVETSDPDGPYLFLEIHTGIDDVMRRKQVMLEVSTQNYISHE